MSWNHQPLGDLVKITKGKKHTPSVDGQYRYINIEDLHKPENAIFTDEKGNSVIDEDVIIAWDGANAGKVGVGFSGVIGSTLAKLKVDAKAVNPIFLFWFLEYNNPLIKSQRTGATIPHVNGGALKDLPIPLPPLPVQKRIAEILDAADALKRKDQELLKKYDELAQAIFIDMFGDPVKNEKGWEMKRLGDYCDVGSSIRVFVDELVDDGVPFYRGTEIGSLSTGELFEPSLFITSEHYDKLKQQGGVPQIGDLLMPSICPDGRIFEVKDDKMFYFKDGRVLWIKVNKTYYNSVYLKYVLKETFYRNYSKIASGTTFAELKIFAVKDLKLFMAPIDLQNQFAERVNKIVQQRDQAKQVFENSEKLFNALIHKAFKGELVS